MKLLTEGTPSLDRKEGEGGGPSLLHLHYLLGIPAVKEVAEAEEWEKLTGWR